MKPTLTLPEKVTRIATSLNVSREIDPNEWVYVAGTKYFVHRPRALNRYTWEDALRQTLVATPFRVTPPSIFMPHFVQVYNAVRKRNPTILYDGAGEPFSRSATDDIYQHRTTNTMVHLDAIFEQREDKLWMLTDHDLVNGELQPTTQQPLESRVIREDGFVELQWNKQGMPVKMSKRQEHMRDKNMKYIAPINNGYMWFVAYSDGFGLNCFRDLRISGAALGVLFCAKGITKE